MDEEITTYRGDIGGMWRYLESEIEKDKDDKTTIEKTIANIKLRKENLLKLKSKLEEAIKEVEKQ